MSDFIPFDIQIEIMKRLPVKSLLQFRSVSKQWKSFIDSPKFIKNYHINHTNPQHHLLVSTIVQTDTTYTSIIDNNTFPQQKFSLTAPDSLNLIRHNIFSSVNGLLCFYGHCGDLNSKTDMAVIWNPTVRKSVDIVIPIPKAMYNVVGFGICPDTSDPKLVKISVYMKPRMWEVEVFTLSTATRVWKTVYTGAPFKLCNFCYGQVFVNRVIYFRAHHYVNRSRFNYVISFDLKSEKLGEVCLPDRLVRTPDLVKVNESLGILDQYDEYDMLVCDVWTREDGANKTFTKIYTVKVKGYSQYDRVLGFRNNGEVVMELSDDDCENSRIEVYEPLSGHTNGVGITGNQGTFSTWSYMETLLLLDHSLPTMMVILQGVEIKL